MGRRFVFVSPRYADSATAGGAETLIRELARHLAAVGHDVQVLCTCARDHFTWRNEIPAGVLRDGAVTVRRFPVDEDRDTALFLRLQTAFCRGRRLSREEEESWLANGVNSPDLIRYLEQESASCDRVLAGPYLFPLVLRAAGVQPENTLLIPCLHNEPFARLATVRDIFIRVRGCLFNSEPERRLAETLFGLDRRRSAVVGLGLDLFEADPDAFARRHHLRAPYAFYCGRREPGKGTPLLLAYMDAFRQRTGLDIRLVLAGSGPIEPRPFIHDAGFLPEARKREALAGASVFIHPSLLESFGIVLLESFLAGVPGLVRAQSEVLRWQCERSGAGLWFRHYPDFEETLHRLLHDPALRTHMGAQGRRYVSRTYAWPTVGRRLEEALAAL